MQFKAVGFDYTGVVVGESASSFNQTISQITSVSPEDFKKAYHNHNNFFNTGVITLEELWKRVLADLDKVSLLNKVFDFLTKPKKLNIEVIQIINDIKSKGYKVALLSNNNEEAGKHMREAEHLDELFEIMLISAETGLTKPNKGAFRDLLSKLKVSTQELIFIDDAQINLDSAKELGISTILYIGPDDLRNQLKEKGIL